MSTPQPVSLPSTAPRIGSIDVYRGIVMFLLGLRLLELDEVAVHFPNSAIWQFLGHHSSHIPWVGASLNDLIHPSFAFLTGASLVFSVSSRTKQGQSQWHVVLHALWRSVALILLGIFLRSVDRDITHWTFDETLTQTGMGYMAVFALAYCTPRTRWVWFTLILTGYWLLYALYPVMPPHATPMDFNTPEGWQHDFSGFFAHWNHNRNVGWSFDRWLLNQFPRESPYVGYLGGYTTLNFIPTIGTMILGLTAGTWLRQANKQGLSPVKTLAVAGAASLALSFILHFGGVCPIVKRLWTPAWVFFSGGLSLLILAALYQIIDIRQWRRWSFAFVVLGMNSLAFYVMRHTMDIWFSETLQKHFGTRIFDVFGTELRPVTIGACTFLVFWLVTLWLYRRKIFIRL
ncbi:acyltransferase family protein [Prosthecobacter sp.]|uniref:acyltransferase family protein n=1 Tax=Prosthecobacter sp. TaxID=1965333 RepID=UPI003783D9C1